MAAPLAAVSMRVGSSRHHKRLSGTRSHDRRTFSLMVHGPEFGTGEEVVVNPECFPDAKVGDLLEISQPERDHHRLILQVTTLNPVRGKLQISILKDVAAQFGLDSYHSVTVQKVEPHDVTVDYLELAFRDQFVSRADIWRVKVALFGKCVYIGKHVAALGVRCQVEALLSNNQTVMCGVVGSDTKMIVRSRSSRLIWLVQMSTEMWEFAPDGELYYEKMLNRLLRVLISKWTECSVSHSVTIIAFSRSYYDKNQFPEGYDPTQPPFRDPHHQGFGPGCSRVDAASGYGPNIHVDSETGQYYEDFYKVLVMNYTGPDWSHLVSILKKEFVQYHEAHRWRRSDEFMPAEYEVCKVNRPDASIGDSTATPPMSPGSTQPSFELSDTQPAPDSCPDSYVKWKSLPYGVPSRAVDGNILEAINVTLNILDKHFMDRDLNRTGQSIVMITAGSSVFRVDERLVEVTKQRMMDNGVGMDMISLATPPLHVVPLFICRSNGASAKSSPPEEEGSARNHSTRPSMLRSPSTMFQQPQSLEAKAATAAGDSEPPASPTTAKALARPFYIVPHWVNITFLEFDCECAAEISINTPNAARQSSKKLLSHRMYTCECQARLNRAFAPLPPFRMFDITAPTDKLAFPIALANMMKRSSPQADPEQTTTGPEAALTGIVNTSPRAQRPDSPRRKLSNLSDTMSTASPVVTPDQWNLCKSPDCVISRPLHSLNFAATGLSASLLAREALEDYDAEVFAPKSWKCKGQGDGIGSPRYGEDTDLTSASLTGDMLSLLTTKTNNRWKSASSHAGLGNSSSLVHSLLSPRNSMTQSRSTSSVNRLPSGGQAHFFSPRRDSPTPFSTASFVAEAKESHAFSSPSATENRPTTGTDKESTSLPQTPGTPPLHSRNHSKAAANESRPRALTSRDDSSTPDASDTATESEDASKTMSRSLKLHDRSMRSPPSAMVTSLAPSPMELGGSYKKSFLTGNGMLPSMRRVESDQTSTTPMIGSLYVQQLEGIPTSTSPSLREVNPFKFSSETLESTAARLTSDRRRWSHLFPDLKHSKGSNKASAVAKDEAKLTFLGPNWKSLTSPAILPLTTDYFPTPKDLFTSYTESFYTLTLPETDGGLFPKYNNHDELLIEMICQRLASDFQLVTKEAGADIDTTKHHGLAGTLNRGGLGVGSGEMPNTSTTYYLSMGHRIHQIIYDAERQAIEVKRYIDRASQGLHNEPVMYKYSLWVDRTQSFHPLQQNFYQYPMPEDNWNSLDHLLCGYHDEMTDMIKYRRIRFAVLPPQSVLLGSQKDKETYATRFTKLVDYLQTRVASEHGAQEKISIKVALDPLPSPNLKQQVGSLSYKMSCDSMVSYTRLKSEDPRNEWLMMHLEDTMHVDKSYHFDVRWLACSGIIVDDFISTIRRKAKQAGLELRRIPEYTSVSFLQIHPLIAPIFLPMPLEIMNNCEREMDLIVALVNRLDFVLDDERLADARGIGYGLGLCKEEKAVETNCSGSRASIRPQRLLLSKEEKEAMLLAKWRKRGYKQYMHRQAPVFLRLIRNGIVWISSYDYDQVSTPQQVEELFKEICSLIHTNSSRQERAASSQAA